MFTITNIIKWHTAIALLLSFGLSQPLRVAATAVNTPHVEARYPNLVINSISFTPAAQNKLTAVELKYFNIFFSGDH
jgi:hypothetical protein